MSVFKQLKPLHFFRCCGVKCHYFYFSATFMVFSTLLAFAAIACVAVQTSSDRLEHDNTLTRVSYTTVTEHEARPLVFKLFASATGFGQWDPDSVLAYDCLAFDVFHGFTGHSLSFPPRRDVLNYNFTKRCIDYPYWHNFTYSLALYEPSVPLFPKNVTSVLKINFRVPPYFASRYMPYIVFTVANGTLDDFSDAAVSSLAFLKLGHANVVLMSETVHILKDGTQRRHIGLKTVAAVPQQLPESNYSNASLVLTWETNTVLYYEDNESVNTITLTALLLGVISVGFASMAYFVDLMEYFANRQKKRSKKREKLRNKRLAGEEDYAGHPNLPNIGEPCARVEAQT